jgi:folate-binding protein YgfZ
LEAFVIADDVTIEDMTTAVSAVTLFGGETDAALVPPDGDGWVFHGRRSREVSIEWVFPTSRREAIQARLAGFRAISADEVARRRIEAGIPAVPADLGPGDLPNEGGLEADAISYTKGCYLGQEVMARLKTMGQVRRRLVRVAFAGEKTPALPTPVFLGARRVGELRSAAPDGVGSFVGLAMVSLLHVGAGARLALAADAPATITVGMIDPR